MVGMPTISFRILSDEEELAAIEKDFRMFLASLDGAIDATFSVTSGLPADANLVDTWEDLRGDAPGDTEEVRQLEVAVQRYELGSISSLAMNLAEILTEREESPSEPLLRQVKDDPGVPRVPWFVEVRPH